MRETSYLNLVSEDPNGVLIGKEPDFGPDLRSVIDPPSYLSLSPICSVKAGETSEKESNKARKLFIHSSAHDICAHWEPT